MTGAVRSEPQDRRGIRFGNLPFHTVLIAIFVWLSPYTSNHSELFLHDMLAAAVITTVAGIAMVAVLWGLLGNPGTAGAIATLIIVCLVYYGHAFDALDGLTGGTLGNKMFMPAWTGLFLVLIALLLIRRPRLENLTKILNAGALVLVLVPLGSFLVDRLGNSQPDVAETGPRLFDLDTLPAAGNSAAEYPDIYYLIFDRYADNRTLIDIYEHDNSTFLDELRARGFHVNDRSRANYTKTAHSLASSLNLRHLTDLSERIGPGSGDWKPVYALLQDYEVARFLKAHGYRYAHLGSWWDPTRENAMADESFDGIRILSWADVSLNGFERLLVEPTLLTRAANLWSRSRYDDHRRAFVRVSRKFDKLAELRRDKAPLFVFAHMLLPHDPYVFFPDGRYKSKAEAEAMTREQNYVEQLLYTNQEILALVDELLRREPQPIIVIQSDEGPFPERYRRHLEEEQTFDWREATVEELRQKFGILNAIYFPDRSYEALYEDLTPVNTFRIVFNRTFGQDLPLLPDTSYSFPSEDDLYSYFDVTDVTR